MPRLRDSLRAISARLTILAVAACAAATRMLVGLLSIGVATVIATPTPTAIAATPKRPYALDDYLALEEIGAAVADPTGRWIVWEQAPSYDRLPGYGIGRHGAFGQGFRLMAVDLSLPRPQAGFLFDPDPQSLYRLDDFSPDGRYLIFYSIEDGRVSMGAYDFQRRRVQLFDAAPRVDDKDDAGGGVEAVWVAADEFVFSAYTPDRQPWLVMRPYTGKRLEEEWRKAWAGREPSVHEVTSHASGEGSWLTGRLIKANARTGSMEILAEDAHQTLAPSPDGRYLAALRQASRTQPTPGKPDLDVTLTRSQLILFDLQADQPPRVIAPALEIFPGTLTWEPGSARLAFFAWEIGRGVPSGLFYVADAATGAVTPYPHAGLDLVSQRERGQRSKPERVMWLNGRLAVLARETRDGDRTPRSTYYRDHASVGDPPLAKADWFLLDVAGNHQNLTERLGEVSAIPLDADGHSITVLAQGDAWRLAPDESPRNLTAAVHQPLSHIPALLYASTHPRFTGHATLVSWSKKRPSFALLDLRAGGVAVVTAPASHAELLASAAGRGAALFSVWSEAGADLLLRRRGRPAAMLDRLNTHLAEVAPTRWQTVRYPVRTANGERQVEGCMLLPPDYERGKRYPLIVEIYPGRGAFCASPQAFPFNGLGVRPGPYSEHLLAARGYVVLQPNAANALIRGPQGPLAGMSDAVLQGVAALVEQGFADSERVGLLGFSQGGFSALWLATQTDRFDAIVSMNGWSDLYSDYFRSLGMLQRFFADEIPHIGNAITYEAATDSDFGLGVNPWQDPEAYLRNSPLFNARKISSPMLLIHSDMDSFNLEQYEMLFTALYRERKEARFLRYWGEAHGPSSPANIRHMWANIFEWFDTHLGAARGEKRQGAH